MSSSLLITCIIFYILSLATALILAIASKKLSARAFHRSALLHFLLLVTFVAILNFKTESTAWPYLMLATICSGLMLSGWAIREVSLNKLLRIYFGLYLASFLLFLYSPSLLFFSISGLRSEYRQEKIFSLRDNYYLVEQQKPGEAINPETGWKVIRKYGIYNKTIQRDIQFNAIPDSVILMEFTEDTMIIRTYFSNNSSIDSLDTGIRPVISKSQIKQQKD